MAAPAEELPVGLPWLQVRQLLRGTEGERRCHSPHGLPGSVGNCAAVGPTATECPVAGHQQDTEQGLG